jgi:hypothetical protein
MDTLEINPKSNDVNNNNDSQNGTLQRNESAKGAKEIVMEYLELITERQDFKSARNYLKDNVSYVSPLNSFDRAEPYLKYNESLHLPKLDIKKVFVDGDDVCILHETNLAKPPATVFTALWFHVDGGKISSLRALFDPRPFIQPQR